MTGGRSAATVLGVALASAALTLSTDLRVDELPAREKPSGPIRYVSCAGADTAAGTVGAPWRTVAAATRRPMPPGTTVLLARGCSWPGPVTLRANGTADRQIVLGAYGSGSDPVIAGSTNANTPAIVTSGDFERVQNVHVTSVAGAGIGTRGKHDEIHDAAIDRAGIGVQIGGPGTVVAGVHATDLHMVVDTPGGDDDYGAIGYDVQAADAEITDSSCTRCRAASHDYGQDGGFAEVWNFGDNLEIRHCTGEDTEGILEIGGNRGASSARRIVVRDSTFTDAHGGFVLHDNGRFAIGAASMTVTGTTIVDTAAADDPVLSGQIRNVVFDGNTVTTAGQVSASGAPASHRHNVYYVRQSSRLGFSAGDDENLRVRAAR